MLLDVKVGDYVRGCDGFAQEDNIWIKKGGVYKILELNAEKEGVRLEGCSDIFWYVGLLEKAFCPKCKKDPCACDDDVELDKGIIHSGRIEGVLVTEHTFAKPLPARALTSWPGLHEKMAAAKLLDELKDD